MEVPKEDVAAIIRDKYGSDAGADVHEDMARLAAGEPLAYVIGWIPFLGLHIDLSSRPLIPRPETEWWTEQLIAHLRERFGTTPFTLLDLCAGSGAIGLAVLRTFPNATVYFGEIVPEHVAQIEQNIEINELDASRAIVRVSDLYEQFAGLQFDVIAANPPYIPEARALPESVTQFEPRAALFSGPSGMDLILSIISGLNQYLAKRSDGQSSTEHAQRGGELWLECDVENIESAKDRAQACGLRATIHEDQYGRPRFLVAHLV